MTSRPIIFSGPMVRAILDGRKTQTRRLVRFEHARRLRDVLLDNVPRLYADNGDHLWVRESLVGGRLSILRYAADGQMVDASRGPAKWRRKWRHDCNETIPSIYMPRWASRLTLEIVRVGLEMLGDISDDDAVAEGIDEYKTIPSGPRKAFAELWDKINGKRASWESNPHVWRIEFRRVEPAAEP